MSDLKDLKVCECKRDEKECYLFFSSSNNSCFVSPACCIIARSVPFLMVS